MATSITDGASARERGELVLAATPIGNLGDASSRLLEELERADVILAEDTRVTGKLLAHFGITTRVERCDENVMEQRIAHVLELVRQGKVCVFVSDAGMPCISDPGQRLVAAFREEGLPVTVIPGPNAAITAVAGSGFLSKSFYFGGFFPRKEGERARLLQALASLDGMLVFYESNHRAISALRAIAAELPGRRVCLARELTKLHEEYLVLPAAQLADELEAREGELKGEVVLVIEPPINGGATPPAANPKELAADIAQLAARLAREEGMPPSKIAKELQRRFGIARDEAYQIARDARG